MDNLRLTTKNIYPHFLQAIEEASSIYFLTSFIQKSGRHYRRIHSRKRWKGELISRFVQGIISTSPPQMHWNCSAPSMVVDLRLYRTGSRSFHPKAYRFGRKTKD